MIRLLLGFAVAAAALSAASSKTALIGSQHDLSISGSGPVKSASVEACDFCHAPHNVTPNVNPLWNHGLSSQTYTTYTSSTYNSGPQTPGSATSKLCLSCHDGTIALGLTITKGQIPTSGALSSADNLTTNLSTSHPVSMTPADDGSLAVSLFGNPPSTLDPAVKLVNGKVECTTCHDPHAPRNDPVVPMFLARSNSGGSLCLACHDASRVQPNQLNGWTSGAHATAGNTVPANASFGSYGTVSANACWSCHNAHNNGAGPRSLKASEEAACTTCHSGSNATPALLNLTAEFSKAYAHPTFTVTGAHDAAESMPVNTTRHAECADCHNSHAAADRTGTPVAPAVEPPLFGVKYDNTGKAAVNEYDVCFKCHADSSNKPATSVYGRTAVRYPQGPLPAGYPLQPPLPADQYDLRMKFSSTIGHNVMGNSVVTTTNRSLRTYMLNINGTNNTARPLTTSTMLYCTDCHNNDQSRADAGPGPNGPHGSTFSHLLELNFYQDPISGNGGGNSTNGSALCNKCHNVSTVNNSSPHGDHRNYSCSDCHDPHGVINGNPGANRGMMNFDTGIAKKATTYWGYYYVSANSKGCYTNCHGENHNPRTY